MATPEWRRPQLLCLTSPSASLCQSSAPFSTSSHFPLPCLSSWCTCSSFFVAESSWVFTSCRSCHSSWGWSGLLWALKGALCMVCVSGRTEARLQYWMLASRRRWTVVTSWCLFLKQSKARSQPSFCWRRAFLWVHQDRGLLNQRWESLVSSLHKDSWNNWLQ